MTLNDLHCKAVFMIAAMLVFMQINSVMKLRDREEVYFYRGVPQGISRFVCNNKKDERENRSFVKIILIEDHVAIP